MVPLSRRKIVVQTYDNKALKPLHFCYVDADVATAYFKQRGCTSGTIIYDIEKWSRIDFGLKLRNTEINNVRKYKKYLTEHIRKTQLDAGVSKELLSFNLLSAWLSKHMEDDLNGTL